MNGKIKITMRVDPDENDLVSKPGESITMCNAEGFHARWTRGYLFLLGEDIILRIRRDKVHYFRMEYCD